MFTITVDPDLQRLNVTVVGLWCRDEAAAYRRAVVAAAQGLPGHHNGFDMLVEISADGVLPADAAIEIEASLTELAALGLRRAAHVTRSAIGTMQLRRIGTGKAVMEFFTTREEASASLVR